MKMKMSHPLSDFIKAEDRAIINIGDEDIIDLRPGDGDIFQSAR